MTAKPLRRVFCTLLVCLVLAAAVPQTGRAADEPPPLLIILLDVSETMATKDQHKEAVSWTVELSVTCREIGIDVEVFTFGKNVDRLDSKTIPDTEISYSELFTNHLSAIEAAEKIVKEGPARKTCIVMISDGTLDLLGRGTIDPETGEYVPLDEPLDSEEEDAMKSFQKKCIELGESGCSLFLVGCGNSDENFEMFKDVDGEPNCTFLCANDMDLSELKQLVYRSLRYLNSTSSDLQLTDGFTITFTLDQPYSKTCVCVNKSVDKEAPLKDDIKIIGDTYTDFYVNGEEYKSMFVICLDEPKEGKYTIELPYGDTYSLVNQTNVNPISAETDPADDQNELSDSNQAQEHSSETTQSFPGKVGEEIDISPSKWIDDIREDIALDNYSYYLWEHSSAESENQSDEALLEIPSSRDEYEIWQDESGAVKIKFKVSGEYFMAIRLYGKPQPEAQVHFTIEDKPDFWEWVAEHKAESIVAVAVIFIFMAVKSFWKKNR